MGQTSYTLLDKSTLSEEKGALAVTICGLDFSF